MIQLNVQEIARKLRGRNGGLRSSKPVKENGLVRYIWRMARFHAGYDTTLPVMCHFELQTYLDELGVKANVCGIIDERGKEILDQLDKVVDQVLDLLGEDKYGAAKAWAKVI